MMKPLATPLMGWYSIIVPAIALLVGSGCGPSTGTVTGKVTFNGQPVNLGTVTIHNENGQVASSLLNEAGEFRITNIKPGLVRITVVTHPSVPPGLQLVEQPPPPASAVYQPSGTKGGVFTSKRRYLWIPERYTHPDHSGLTLTVESGEQSKDLVLTP